MVRGQSSKMMLTSYAKSLLPKIKQINAEIKVIFSGSLAFDPIRSHSLFYLGMSDYLTMVLLPNSFQEISSQAPQIKLVIRHLNYLNDIFLFEREKCDLAIGSFDNASDILLKQKLFTDEPVCVAHKSHPAFKNKTISLENYASYPHVLVGLEEDPSKSFIIELMKKKGYNLQVAAIVPHTLTALYTLLPHTQFIASTVLRIAKEAKNYSQLAVKPMPFHVGKYTCSQYWHPKDTEDPAHQWLRSIVKKISEEL